MEDTEQLGQISGLDPDRQVNRDDRRFGAGQNLKTADASGGAKCIEPGRLDFRNGDAGPAEEGASGSIPLRSIVVL